MSIVGSVCIYEVFESLGYVLEICAEWMREDTEVQPYDATVLALPRLYGVSDHGQPDSF